MHKYFVPKSVVIKLPSGKRHKLVRGIHPVPDELANHADGNKHGIKPVEEMTDKEYRSLGLKRPPATS
ncbi:MAG: hypothetical protein P4M05_28380 [Bradyrhizobium sp.]|nr:hypothetical protein [Bradyrhizobium sp.]